MSSTPAPSSTGQAGSIDAILGWQHRRGLPTPDCHELPGRALLQSSCGLGTNNVPTTSAVAEHQRPPRALPSIAPDLPLRGRTPRRRRRRRTWYVKIAEGQSSAFCIIPRLRPVAQPAAAVGGAGGARSPPGRPRAAPRLAGHHLYGVDRGQRDELARAARARRWTACGGPPPLPLPDDHRADAARSPQGGGSAANWTCRCSTPPTASLRMRGPARAATAAHRRSPRSPASRCARLHRRLRARRPRSSTSLPLRRRAVRQRRLHLLARRKEPPRAGRRAGGDEAAAPAPPDGLGEIGAATGRGTHRPRGRGGDAVGRHPLSGGRRPKAEIDG